MTKSDHWSSRHNWEMCSWRKFIGGPILEAFRKTRIAIRHDRSVNHFSDEMVFRYSASWSKDSSFSMIIFFTARSCSKSGRSWKSRNTCVWLLSFAGPCSVVFNRWQLLMIWSGFSNFVSLQLAPNFSFKNSAKSIIIRSTFCTDFGAFTPFSSSRKLGRRERSWNPLVFVMACMFLLTERSKYCEEYRLAPRLYRIDRFAEYCSSSFLKSAMWLKAGISRVVSEQQSLWKSWCFDGETMTTTTTYSNHN